MTSKKNFTLYDPYTVYFLSIGIGFMILSCAGLSLFFCYRFIIVKQDAGVILLLLILDVPSLLFVYKAVKEGLFHRLTLRISIDKIGLRCSGIGWKPFSIQWEEIHTFGYISYSVAYVGRQLLLLSKNKKELAPKTIQEANRVDDSRLIIQFREDIWIELQKYMPKDIRLKIADAVSTHRDCFYKR